MNILIVDDDSSKILRIKETLKDFLIDVAMTIKEAEVLIKQKHYNLIILDIKLPANLSSEPNANHTIKLLKRIARDSEVYNRPGCIVGLTAYEDLAKETKNDFARCASVILNYSEINNEWSKTLKEIVKFHSFKEENKKVDVCILTALDDPEALAFIKYVQWNWSSQKPLSSKLFGWEGIFLDKNSKPRTVILCSQQEMGISHASLYTSKLLYTFSPRLFVMSGICAGLQSKSNYGDIIIAKASWNYNRGKMINDLGHLKFLPSVQHSEINNKLDIELKAFSQHFMRQIDSINEFFDDKSKINNSLKLKIFFIASGSAVLNDKETILNILSSNRDLDGVDMEVDAFYITCKFFEQELDYFAVKSVCDFADGDKNDNYQKYAAFTSALTIKEFLEKFYEFE